MSKKAKGFRVELRRQKQLHQDGFKAERKVRREDGTLQKIRTTPSLPHRYTSHHTIMETDNTFSMRRRESVAKHHFQAG